MNFKSLYFVFLKPSQGKLGLLLLLSFLQLKGQQEQFSQAQQLAISGQHSEAEALLGELTAAHPDYLPAALLRAHNLSWSGQYRQSIDAFNAILQQQPGQTDALVGLGYAFSWSGAGSQAIDAFQRAIEQAPDNTDARKGLGYAYLADRDPQSAIQVFEYLARDYPEVTEYHIALGKARLLAGRHNAAKQSFEEALATDPSNGEAQLLLAISRTQGSALEMDIWGGYSKVEEASRTGLRLLQALYRINRHYSVFARFDNTLSLDNLDFVNRNSNASSLWGGVLAGWNDRLATRLEYGLRFFPERNTQQQARLEQVFYIHNGFSLRLGGWAGFSSDFPTEWYSYAGLYIPVNQYLALEPSFYYGKDGLNSVNQQRAVLAAKLLLPQGPEFTLGGFFGKANLGIEGIPDEISGGYLLALIPLNDWLSGQLAANYEKGNFASATVLAAGLKLRFK
ncbi:MAG: tetratricopeptide repeat protein [Phaeodactylibacter sp.]|nr:tetratricopeptide repeat protein [Phaeodactylibacter sp.]